MYGTKISTSHWSFPQIGTLAGRYIQLTPLKATHLGDLWPLARDAPESFAYLRYGPFASASDMELLISDLAGRPDQPFWAVLDHSGHALGWLSICDVYQNDGAFEIGSIWFSPGLQGSAGAREAIYLLMRLGMDSYGYERLVWRCQAENQQSFQAVLNLGFTHEGTWRNAAVVDGWQRGIAWFSILKSEWPLCAKAFDHWLDPSNFDANTRQLERLQDIRARL